MSVHLCWLLLQRPSIKERFSLKGLAKCFTYSSRSCYRSAKHHRTTVHMRQSGCSDAMNYRASLDAGPAASAVAAGCRMREMTAEGWRRRLGGPSCPIQRRRDVDTRPMLTITTCVNGERWRRRRVVETPSEKTLRCRLLYDGLQPVRIFKKFFECNNNLIPRFNSCPDLWVFLLLQRRRSGPHSHHSICF